MSIEALISGDHAGLTARLVRMVGPEAAEDVRQEALARAWQRAPRDAAPEHQRAWLHATASNLAIDELRRRRRRDWVELESLELAASAPPAEQRLAADDALGRLTAHERLLLLMRFQAGLSHAELAELLEISEPAVRKRLSRARERFMHAFSAARGEHPPRILLLLDGEPETPYRRWLEHAGAHVDVLDGERPEQDLASADGLVVSGNHRDIHPGLYGEQIRAELHRPDLGRDRRALRAMRQALAQNLPIVGICRGHQLLNIALGGTLYQDLEQDGVASLAHLRAQHHVSTGEGSEARRLLGRRTEVSSEHHQATRRLGRGLRVSSLSGDGVVEAVELPGRHLALGLQWHPEHDESGPGGRRVADALVEVAARRAA